MAPFTQDSSSPSKATTMRKHFQGLLLGAIIASRLLEAQEIPLLSPYQSKTLEYSGLAWHGDTLVLLPQYPGDVLPSISRSQLQHSLQTGHGIQPSTLMFNDTNIRRYTKGFEGYEALIFHHDDVYMLIEAREFLGSMRAYLCKGHFSNDTITLDHIIALPMPIQMPNYAFEALTIVDNMLYLIYEANGVSKNPPLAYRADLKLQSIQPIPIASLNYRVTDATESHNGVFWVINSFWIGDTTKLKVSRRNNMARLVEFHMTQGKLEQTGRRYLINEGGTSYNWEGIVRFHKGVLLITDTHPATVMRYIQLD